MKYEFLLNNDEDVEIYARIDDDGKCRVTCSENNPEYQAWLAEQALPTPPVEEPIDPTI